MEVSTAACCKASVDVDMTELEEILADPTLDTCCRRDALEQRRVSALKEKLLSLDRTTHRLKLACAVIDTRPQRFDLISNEEAEISSTGSSSDETDAEMAYLRQKRIKGLRDAAIEKLALRTKGHGGLTDVPWRNMIARAEDDEECCVCHLAVEGCQACDELDQVMEALAHRFQGTLFLRSSVSSRGAEASSIKAVLGVQGLPALVCLRQGSIVGRTYLEMFGPAGEIYEEEVLKYLRRLSMLQSSSVSRAEDTGTVKALRLSRSSSITENREASGSEEEAGSRRGAAGRRRKWLKDGGNGGIGDGSASSEVPCEVCGRRYPHEHVRAVYRTRAGPSEEEGDDGGSGLEDLL
ncbi:hypothetical protein CEUSTIGMA_g6787.t1 [Chlamydomonas eustigma]|uniref:Phosducin thioredoxin-like domain-containing protein n=1 Tax=Chlamydomonas eustigma TaxID=1157962 RepID=A0A250X8E8_9CHLO|nr:hypothetical protein CEUSTIGMA_g6787.t1 [Chlamydomonas eustigma]|eukprot:GAX79345.1 hypothetical protein CEUSTIGMA_g6787.t1 [Chlamydomonas eustigma]